jgi:hypothetical protein
MNPNHERSSDRCIDAASRRDVLKAALVAGGVAGVGDIEAAAAGSQQDEYDWLDVTLDAYWYSLYNMNTTIAVSGVGLLLPRTEKQRAMFQQRLAAILKNSDVERPPIQNANLNQVPFTSGDPVVHPGAGRAVHRGRRPHPRRHDGGGSRPS